MLGRPEFAACVLIVAAFVIGAVESPYFLDARYLLDSSTLYAETALIAIGMTFVIVSGNIDLSVGGIMAMSACLTAKLLASGMPAWEGCSIALAVAGAMGWFNGLMVARLRLNSVVVTLGTMAAYRGLAQVMMGSQSVQLPASFVGIDEAYVFGSPVPWELAGWVGLAVCGGVVLHRSVFGRGVFAVGSSEAATRYSGLRVERIKAWCFVISGLMAGLAGLAIDSRLGVARYDHGVGVELDAITAVVLGGASIYGGRGTMAGTVLALVLLALIRTGMGVANLEAQYQLAAVGGLLVVAVVFSQVSARAAEAK